VAEPPPASLRAPLWWIGDASAFPQRRKAAAVDGMRYVDSARVHLGQPDHGVEHRRHRLQLDVVIGEVAEHIGGDDAVRGEAVEAALVELAVMHRREVKISRSMRLLSIGARPSSI
jgi:hypothetical protein